MTQPRIDFRDAPRYTKRQRTRINEINDKLTEFAKWFDQFAARSNSKTMAQLKLEEFQLHAKKAAAHTPNCAFHELKEEEGE